MVLMAGGLPAVAVASNPVEQGPLETDIGARFFGFDPLVF